MHVKRVVMFLAGVMVMMVAEARRSCEESSWPELSAFEDRVKPLLDQTEEQRPLDTVITICGETIGHGGLQHMIREQCPSSYHLEDRVGDLLDELCDPACADYVNIEECLNRATVPQDSDTVCGDYTTLQTTCVHRLLDESKCNIRDALFLAAVETPYLEALYDAGCVPRPVEITTKKIEITSQDVSNTNLTTTTTESNTPSPTTLISTTRATGDPQTTSGSDVSFSTYVSPAVPVCDVAAARVCIHQRQRQIDMAASAAKDLDDNLVVVCLATERADEVTRCYHDSMEGCGEGEGSHMVTRQMWKDTTESAQTLCKHWCSYYSVAFRCFKSIVPEPLSRLCETRKLAILCASCPLAANMLHVLIKDTVPPAHINVCETEAPCPDLLKALTIMEKCAHIHWLKSEATCNEAWSVERCLVQSGLYSLQCRDFSKALQVVLAGYQQLNTTCTTTTTITTTTTTSTTTTTTKSTTTTSTTGVLTTSSPEPSTSRKPSTTIATTVATTVDYQALKDVIQKSCDVDGSLINRDLSDLIKASVADVTSEENRRQQQIYLDVCIQLLAFLDCLRELTDCQGPQLPLCQSALPSHLAHVTTWRSWCARAVRDAATDMHTLQLTGEEGEGNYTLGEWERGRSNSSCSSDGTSILWREDVVGFLTRAMASVFFTLLAAF